MSRIVKFGGGFLLGVVFGVMLLSTADKQPDRNREPAQTAARTATPDVRAAPPPAEPVRGGLEILEIDTRVTERNDSWWRYAWKLIVYNDSDRPARLDATIKFLDRDGFVVDKDNEYDLVIRADEEREFTGFALVDASVAESIDQIRARVEKR